MGEVLSDNLGDRYYAIGTDYFYSVCNLPYGGKRVNHKFCSADRFAYQAKYMDEEAYLLNFKSASQNEELAALLNDYNYAGDLGESYSPLMRLLPVSTRQRVIFTDLYDSMIFEFKVTPITVQ